MGLREDAALLRDSAVMQVRKYIQIFSYRFCIALDVCKVCFCMYCVVMFCHIFMSGFIYCIAIHYMLFIGVEFLNTYCCQIDGIF